VLAAIKVKEDEAHLRHSGALLHEIHLHFALALRLHFPRGVKVKALLVVSSGFAVVSSELSVARLAPCEPTTDNCELSSTSFTNAYVLSLMFTCPTSPLLSMRLAVFTVSPQMSY
jgi:hypothetical protein